MGNSVCEEEVGTTMLYEHENDRYVSKQANFTLINKVINKMMNSFAAALIYDKMQ